MVLASRCRFSETSTLKRRVADPPGMFCMAGGDSVIGPDNTVYVSGGREVRALNGATGAQKWVFDAGENLGSCPAIGLDGMLYLGSPGGKLYGLDNQTGTRKWVTDIRAQSFGDYAGDPAVGADGTVYSTSARRWHGRDDDGPFFVSVYALNGTTGNAMGSTPYYQQTSWGRGGSGVWRGH